MFIASLKACINAFKYLSCFKKDALQIVGVNHMSLVYFPSFGMMYIITDVRV